MPDTSAIAPEKDNFPPRILIIDDNQSIHRDFELVFHADEANPELAADALRLYGTAIRPAVVKPTYILDHALSGVEGVEKVKQGLADGRVYQLAFVDIRMPGIDGVDMRLPADERQVMSGPEQQSAIVASDRSCTDDRDLHALLLSGRPCC